VLKVIAGMTPGETDDKLVAAIELILTDKLLEVIERLVGGMTGHAAADITILAVDLATAQAAAVPLVFLVRLSLQLVDLLTAMKQPSVVPV